MANAETLEGQIERVTYHDEESGFTIAQLKVADSKRVVTVVGNLISSVKGSRLKLKGEWGTHPKFGEQFKISQCETLLPSDVEGIRKYLGSGLIKGIGPKTAKLIVDKFGIETLSVIENETDRLGEISGIGKKSIERIREAWLEQSEVRDVMIFLRARGVSPAYASKIFKRYGRGSIAKVSENPYRLATDIRGIGFKIADSIAKNMGFPGDSPFRVRAGILYVLEKCVDEGHTCFPHDGLVEKSVDILQVPVSLVEKSLTDLRSENRIVIRNITKGDQFVFLSSYDSYEGRISGRLKDISSFDFLREIKTEEALAWVQKELGINLADMQKKAVKTALDSKVMVITGGPGTGKTTIINSVLKIFRKKNARVMLSAPTGRAAKRLGETTGYVAKTLHRLLEFSFVRGGFQKHQDAPLECDVLVVDEASMIDTYLMSALLNAVPDTASLILVGDVNQLPSVGAGNVLKDIIESGMVSVVQLNEIFRQARQSEIIINAHKINSGIIPDTASKEKETDFYFINQNDPERVVDIITELVNTRIPGKFGFDSCDDIQVLTPMHKGLAGAENLNIRLQKALNSENSGVTRGSTTYLLNDKVMQVKNNYDKDVFNGDIGRITEVFPEEKAMVVTYDEREVKYEYSEIDEVVPAYAVSVHKSQGSEYPAIVMPVMTQHYVLLQRNLLYTGVTRGKKLVVLVGSKKALAMAVKNDSIAMRYTGLKERLRQGDEESGLSPLPAV